jgi:AcrR family transcriptional regulator
MSTEIHGTSAERILQTALQLFSEKGYDATAVREICEASGITKPTLYHFFGSKEGVLQALVNSGFEEFTSTVRSSLETSGTLRERLKVVARSLFDSARTKPHLWRFVHSVVWAPPGTAVQPPRCSEFYEGVVALLSGAADDAVAAGELSPGLTSARVLILLGSISEAATGFVISGRPQLTDELADTLIDTILDGWTR